MKISLVQMRALPEPAPRATRPTPFVMHRAVATSSAPSLPRLIPPCPASVDAASWLVLASHLDDVQRDGPISTAPLRNAVRTVVRELRAAGELWDMVYASLASAVAHEVEREVKYPLELEIYRSRSAALVAHMHCWADVERLKEIESETTTN